MEQTRDKRITFKMNEIRDIATAAASKGMTAKAFMEQSVIAAAIMVLTKLKKK